MTTALEGGEGSASRPGRSLPPGKTRYPLYRRLGGHQGSPGRAEKSRPRPGFDHRTFQPVASHYTDWATRPTALSECKNQQTDWYWTAILRKLSYCIPNTFVYVTKRMNIRGKVLSKFLHQLIHKFFKRSIKIYIKTAPTCFGLITTIRKHTIWVC